MFLELTSLSIVGGDLFDGVLDSEGEVADVLDTGEVEDSCVLVVGD